MQKHILYPFLSDHKKSEMILSAISGDIYCQKIIQKMKKNGYKIDFTWFGQPAAYFPKIVTVTQKNASFKKEHYPIKAHFSFSRRFSFAYHCHHFIHELLHYEQDSNGEFLTPLLIMGQKEVFASRDDYIYNYLHLEAMAAIQAIAISYDLNKNHDNPYAWRGCFYSFNWHSLSKIYAGMMEEGKAETDIFEYCYQAWFKTKQKRYAFDIAVKNYNYLNNIVFEHNRETEKECAGII